MTIIDILNEKFLNKKIKISNSVVSYTGVCTKIYRASDRNFRSSTTYFVLDNKMNVYVDSEKDNIIFID